MRQVVIRRRRRRMRAEVGQSVVFLVARVVVTAFPPTFLSFLPWAAPLLPV